jgi:hypothetical protein
MKEKWIEFYRGMEVSNLGNVRTYYKKGSGKIQDTPTPRKLTINKNGVPSLSLGRESVLLKSLVATHFLRYNGKDKICHLDKDTSNCKAENLHIMEGIPKGSAYRLL